MVTIKVKRINSNAVLPDYSYPGDAGLDLYSIEDKTIKPGEIALIHTGIIIELPHLTEAQVRPRSGLALKYGITVLNTPGTIDEGYRGEIGVILINHGKKIFNVTEHMRIAQLIVKPVLNVMIEEVFEISSSERGIGGFGSSGYSEDKR
jgi:dUTP pyrophosphatase